MAEIGLSDLASATKTRLGGDVPAQAALDAVLVAARRHCGWHVSPVKTGDVLTLDGPGIGALDLPTGKLNALTSVVENGTSLDVARLDWSKTGVVRKQSGAWWSSRYRSIVAIITHGFTEAEAVDWRRTIIAMVDAVSYASAAVGEDGPLKRKKVDDVEYEWFDAAAEQALLSVSAVLDAYRLPEVLFA